MRRAQVSVETWISVLILFVFFIVSLGLLGEINAAADSLKRQASEWNECTKLARLAEEVFVQGPGTQVETSSSNSFLVSSRAVYRDGSNGLVCDFSAVVQPSSLAAGTIRVSNSSGIVVLKNA